MLKFFEKQLRVMGGGGEEVGGGGGGGGGVWESNMGTYNIHKTIENLSLK